MELHDIQFNNNTIINAVKVKNASFSYDGKSNVLNDCNMTVPCGQIYSLIGPSGCGKTTLLRCILRRIKHQNGTFTIFGENISPLSKLKPITGNDINIIFT